jgi:hypothetical protein
MSKDKNIKDVVDKVLSEQIATHITTDGYVFFTFTEEILEILHDQSKTAGKVVVAVHVPALLN